MFQEHSAFGYDSFNLNTVTRPTGSSLFIVVSNFNRLRNFCLSFVHYKLTALDESCRVRLLFQLGSDKFERVEFRFN